MNKKNFNIWETRKILYARDNYCCQHPGCDVMGWDNLQMAHRIAKTESNEKHIIEFWRIEFQEQITNIKAKEILNHKLNLITSCSRHNSKFNIGNKPQVRDWILKLIKYIMDRELEVLEYEFCN